jgi:hypothetical protein
LPYDYPRDYFLQHAFAIKRFDEKKLVSKYPLFRAYYHSRQWLTDRFFGWTRRWSKKKPADQGMISAIEN